jgi:hypothetical protein
MQVQTNQLPWYLQGITPTPVRPMPQPGSPLLPGQTPTPYMQFAPPQMQPQMQPMPQQNIQPVPRPMPQPGVPAQSGGMFGVMPPAAAAAQPARGLFGGRFDNLGQRFTDVMRENPMAWSAVASGLMDKRQNNNVTFSEITGNAIRAGEYDTENKEKREEKAKEAKRESVTRKWVMGMGFSEEDADAAMAEPEILNFLIQQRSGRDPTAIMQEYEWAVEGGYTGSPIDFIRDRKDGTTINVGPTGIDYGEPPPDMAWQRNPDGTVKQDERGVPIALPIHGSKLQRQEETEQKTAATSSQRAQQAGNVVVQDIERALTEMDNAILPTTGIVGNTLKNVPGTAAGNVAALTETVKANTSFSQLNQMRAESPTGGALGNVTERELSLLQSAIGNLEQSQTEPQLRDNLKRVKNIYLDIVHGPDAGPPREPLGFEQGGNEGWQDVDGVQIREMR